MQDSQPPAPPPYRQTQLSQDTQATKSQNPLTSTLHKQSISFEVEDKGQVDHQPESEDKSEVSRNDSPSDTEQTECRKLELPERAGRPPFGRRNSLDPEYHFQTGRPSQHKINRFARSRSGSIQPAVISVSMRGKKTHYHPQSVSHGRHSVIHNKNRLQAQEEEIETDLISENVSIGSEQNEANSESFDKAEDSDTLQRMGPRGTPKKRRPSANPFGLSRRASFHVGNKPSRNIFRRQSSVSNWSQRRANIIKMRKSVSCADSDGGGAYGHVTPALLPDSPSLGYDISSKSFNLRLTYRYLRTM